MGGRANRVILLFQTDTLEETAYFIDATLQCDKPVVVVGAMRPSTAVSADGCVPSPALCGPPYK